MAVNPLSSTHPSAELDSGPWWTSAEKLREAWEKVATAPAAAQEAWMATPWLLRAACDLCRSPADIETLRPVLDALGTHGKSPWKLRDTSSLEGPGCLYDTFARHGASDAILAWCWSLPDAPKHLEKDLDRRVRSDRLREQLDRSEWTGEPSKLRQMLRAGNKWTEIWADGQTTWERALGVQLPIDALARRWDIQALFDGCSAARRVEGIRRMAASFLEEAPHDKAVFAAVLWAGWMGLEENERAAGSVRDPLPPWSKRDWRRPFRGLVKDVAHARGWEGPPAAWEERAWDEAWNWAASRPPSKALAQVAWAAAQARCEETWDAAKSRGDNSSPPIDSLMDETCRRFCRKTLTQSGAVLNAFLNSISTQEGLPSASRPGHGFLWVQKVALPEDPTETWWWAWAFYGDGGASTRTGRMAVRKALEDRRLWSDNPGFDRCAADADFRAEFPMVEAAMTAIAAHRLEQSLPKAAPTRVLRF